MYSVVLLLSGTGSKWRRLSRDKLAGNVDLRGEQSCMSGERATRRARSIWLPSASLPLTRREDQIGVADGWLVTLMIA